jgi:hypothetical protein
MIEAKDLRIGNLVTIGTKALHYIPNSDNIFEVELLGRSVVHFKGLGSGEFYGDLKGIPLTEEWLKRLGLEVMFEEGKVTGAVYNILFKEAGMLIEVFHNKQDKCWNFGNWFPSKVNVLYVHQLQNIIYLLTGEELTIKEVITA